FPDIATRSLAFVLSQLIQGIIVIGVCDYNPCGLSLLLTFRLGSRNMAFEGQGLQLRDMK
ncbi:SPO11-2, partial [Symbiodinium microadriaticum]